MSDRAELRHRLIASAASFGLYDRQVDAFLEVIEAHGYDVVKRETKPVTLMVTLPAEDVEALWTIADKNGTSVPAVLRQIVTERLAKGNQK